jgi:hypothetical protein
VLGLAGLPLLFGLLVLELAIIEQPTDGRNSRWRYFDKVQLAFSRYFERLRDGHDAQPHTLIVNDEDFSGPDAVVNSKFSGYCVVS